MVLDKINTYMYNRLKEGMDARAEQVFDSVLMLVWLSGRQPTQD
jgi:hypothetical protein